MNGVVVLSLPEIAPAALQLHILWGTLAAALAIFGPRCWRVDSWLERRRPGAQ